MIEKREIPIYLTRSLFSVDNGETKAVIASLHFILNNAAKYAVAEETLSNELTQLGLPKGSSFSAFDSLISCNYTGKSELQPPF